MKHETGKFVPLARFSASKVNFRKLRNFPHLTPTVEVKEIVIELLLRNSFLFFYPWRGRYAHLENWHSRGTT